LFKVNLNQIIEPKATPRSVKEREMGANPSLSPFLRNRDDPPFSSMKRRRGPWAIFKGCFLRVTQGQVNEVEGREEVGTPLPGGRGVVKGSLEEIR